uniref:MD-2-related lipid-recognition domain-containing protein n=1 Tax=Palpitomonas bilix TaxID=652834 RepID=A0A7S3GLX1_9EUKA
MRYHLVACVLLAFACCHTVTATAWTDCVDTSAAHWSVSSFDSEPSSVQAGQNITVNMIFATNGVVVTGGQVETKVSLKVLGKFIQVHTEKYNLCAPTFPCPVNQPVAKIFNSAAIPSSAPAGSYLNEIDVIDQDGNTVGCVSYEYSITH